MIAPASQAPAPSRRPWWRGLVAIPVLVAVFLMHGMPASADSACASGSATVTASLSSQAVTADGAAVGATQLAPDSAFVEHCDCNDSMGVVCTPLNQQGAGALLAALLLALAWVSTPQTGGATGLASAPRRARRTRPWTGLLALTCVCRT